MNDRTCKAVDEFKECWRAMRDCVDRLDALQQDIAEKAEKYNSKTQKEEKELCQDASEELDCLLYDIEDILDAKAEIKDIVVACTTIDKVKPESGTENEEEDDCECCTPVRRKNRKPGRPKGSKNKSAKAGNKSAKAGNKVKVENKSVIIETEAGKHVITPINKEYETPVAPCDDLWCM
jgi:hypothetical protein